MRRFLLLSLLAGLPAFGADWYVSPDGRDDAAGTAAAPFRTVQAAADRMQPGDTCHLRGGTYRETVRPKVSGEAGRPLRFVAEPGGPVVISGADPLAGPWSVHRERIYQAATAQRFIQLFVDGRMMTEARWPNAPLGDLMVMPRATAAKGTDYETLADPNLPPGDWNGALVLLQPGSRWSCVTRKVTGYVAGQSFKFDRTVEQERKDSFHAADPFKPRDGNPYLLFGTLTALDSAGEWYQDPERGTVYLWSPGGDSPAAHQVEVKQRDVAFDLSGLGFIELHGLQVFAAAVDLSDAHDCVVEDCHLRYLHHYREMEIYRPAGKFRNVTSGRHNVWRKCSLIGSAGPVLALRGEDNRIEDSILRDGDYSSSNNCVLDASGSRRAVIDHCTLTRSGRDILLYGGSKEIRITHNELWGANLLNNDSGAIYGWGKETQNGEIAWNFVHDNLGDSTVGIYLDNFCNGFKVHHNVVWNVSGSAIRLNSDATDHLVANNTIGQCREPIGTYCYAKYVPTMKGTRIVNNNVLAPMRLNDPSQFVQGELGPQIDHNAACAVGPDGFPTRDSGAIDAGVAIPGVTDGFAGKAPDIGAYEVGAPRWTYGATWRDPDAPAAPKVDLSFAPRPPVTDATMVREGLQLWLDAADAKTIATDAAGAVTIWRDKSGKQHDAVAAPKPTLTVVPDGLNGKPVVRGAGTGALRVGTLRRERGPFSLFVVSGSAVAGGPSWQRIMGAWDGLGKDWEAPSWQLARQGGAKPEAYPTQIWYLNQSGGHVLDNVVVFGPGTGVSQYLTGDIAEVLLFDRLLRFDELEALQRYLAGKWGVGATKP